MRNRLKGKDMQIPEKRSFDQRLNTWVQTIGIIVAASWGVYTFVYKEIVVPKGAPINVSIAMTMKRVSDEKTDLKDLKKKYAAIELTFVAENPSTRMVFLLPSAWIVYGVKIANLPDRSSFRTDAEIALKSDARFAELHAVPRDSTVVVIGRLFPDDVLKPGEKVVRTAIFHIPVGTYDLLDAHAMVPSARKGKAVDIKWKLSDDNQLMPTTYRIAKDGSSTEVKMNEQYPDQDPAVELQNTRAMTQLSVR